MGVASSCSSAPASDESLGELENRFDWINVPPLCFCALSSVPKIAQSTPVLEYKHKGGDEDSCSLDSV